MNSDLRARVERVAEIHALYNALKHDSDANAGAILGPMMADHPEFRAHGDTVASIVQSVVETVNDRDRADRRERLAELDPDHLAELEAEPESDDSEPLPTLPGTDAVDEVRLRCAPNPNGPWHIGSARMGAVMGTYASMYDGWLLVRFDDTDPATKRPDPAAYDMILTDLDYLGFTPDAVVRASDRMELYYDRAREVIEHGGAYACTCPQSTFASLKREGEPCPHREQSIEEALSDLESMIAGEYSAGEIVLRIRTDMAAPNPAERDWVALRVVDEAHPLESAADYRCWPMLDYQSAIDDHELGITHIIRGKDLQDSARRQGYLYAYFDWTYPEVVHWGRIRVDEYDVPMSTSELRARINDGSLVGWSDARAPTLRALRRRGIRGEAVTEAMLELGVSTSDVSLSMSSIYARNRELVDDEADRFFMVRDGRVFSLIGDVPDAAHPPRHPTDAARGDRHIPLDDRVAIEARDVPDHGERVWLKGIGCVELIRDAFSLTGEPINVVRDEDVPVIHWVPADRNVEVDVQAVEGSYTAQAEPGFRDAPLDAIVQFERVGFARVDEQRDDRTIVYFAHG